MIQITLPNEEILEIEENTTIQTIVNNHNNTKPIYACTLQGKLYDLNYKPKESGCMEFIYSDSETGRIIYERTLMFLFITAVHTLYKNVQISVEHSLSNGQYCVLHTAITYDVVRIQEKMKEMVKDSVAIQRSVRDTNEVIAHFQKKGMNTKAKILSYRKSTSTSIYRMFENEDYFYGIMLPNVSYITHFSLKAYRDGIWLSPYDILQDQPQLFNVFQEFERWGKLVGVSNVPQLNEKIAQHQMDTLVLMSETMVEKKLAELASSMLHTNPNTKFIVISGPSSAGKTTFSRRLAIHLRILGKQPLTISMDNFYHNRKDSPKLVDGSYDFECLEALDLKLFQSTMMNLLNKKKVRLPIYNFKSGLREWQKEETKLLEDEIVIIEGIHGLNPKTIEHLPKNTIYKIYINALTHLNFDEHNRIPTSYYRLIRRIARDYQFRSWSAQETIRAWKNVRDGEDKYIYPYQEEADVVFNTSMIYELPVLKKIVLPLLRDVHVEEKEYLESNRIRKFLEYFLDGDEGAVPRNSILAEFIGNSVFDVN